MIRKIGVVTGTRAEYGYLRPLLFAIIRDPDLDLKLYVTGMHLLKEYGDSIEEIRADNFEIAETVEMGSKAMDSEYDLAVSIGTGVVGFSKLFKKEKPDIFIVFGDRTEPFAASIAATAMNIPVAHIAGGDVGVGDIDHIMRHAITKLSHIHFPMTELSKSRVIKLGEEEWRIFNVGSLTLDTILEENLPSDEEIRNRLNLGNNQYILVTYHPTSIDWEQAENQVGLIFESIAAVIKDKNVDIVAIYPNDYPGGSGIVNVLQNQMKGKKRVHIFENMPHRDYIALMKFSAVFVGNSSSGIIEAPSLGVPYVCVGTRQATRERARNVIDVDYDRNEIMAAINKALSDNVFLEVVAKCETPYGDGKTSGRIIHVLKTIELSYELLVKRLTY